MSTFFRFTGRWSFRLDGQEFGWLYRNVHSPLYMLAYRLGFRPIFRRNV